MGTGYKGGFDHNCSFSEEINIHKGYELIGMFGNESDFAEGWEENTRTQVEREIITIE